MAFMARWMGGIFPADVPIYPALGNNDSGCNDYGMDTQFQRSAARSWAPLAQRGGGAPGFVAAFDSGGYYTARPPAAGVTLVMLNDIYWSRDYDPACGPDRGAAELAWLGRVLDATRAANGRAWLAAHIPPGIDIYSSLTVTPVLMMDTAVAARYDSTIIANAGTVTLQLTGHTHMNEFRVYATGTGGVPDVGVPAVTPLFYNNPGFASMRLASSGEVLDYTVYALTGASTAPGFPAGWNTLFDFGATYRQSAVTGASMLSAVALIAQDTTVRAAWELNYSGGHAGQNPTASNWVSYWCGIRNLDASSYQACVQGGAGAGPTP
jgi:sphingomyelin phosphodiesterase acid-like 3